MNEDGSINDGAGVPIRLADVHWIVPGMFPLPRGTTRLVWILSGAVFAYADRDDGLRMGWQYLPVGWVRTSATEFDNFTGSQVVPVCPEDHAPEVCPRCRRGVDVSRADESEKAAKLAVWVLVAIAAIVLLGMTLGRV